MVGAAAALIDGGVERVYACATHGILSGPAPERLRSGPIEELIVTDSIAVPQEKRDGKIKVLSIAGLLGEAIHRIHGGLSVGEMFDRS